MNGFELRGKNGEFVKLEILAVMGFPNETSFRGGYEIRCDLQISIGSYIVNSQRYYSCTGSLYDFYVDLRKCYETLNGTAHYSVYLADNPLELNLTFNGGQVHVDGIYQDNPSNKNRLFFEFETDQSFIATTLIDLSRIVANFGDRKGVINK